MAGSVATVASLEGQAWAKGPDGKIRELKVGDRVAADELVITAPGAHIDLDFGDGHPVSIAGGQEVAMDQNLWHDLAADNKDAAVQDASVQEALTVLNNGGDLTESLEETAAGLTGGGGNEGHSFVELTRVVEQIDPQAFNFGIATTGATSFPESQSSAVPVNQAPEVASQGFTGNEDTVISGQVAATDLEGDTLTYALVGQAGNGSVSINPATGAFTYTPNANFNGPDSFVVTVTDSHGNATTTTISLGVNPVNDAPTSANQSLTTAEDTPVSGKIAASDVEGDRLSYSLSTQPAHGTVTLDAATGDFVYTPAADYNGADRFVVSISDGNGGVTTSEITLGVTPVNDAPVAGNQTLTTAEDTPVSGNVSAQDVDGDTLAYSLGAAAAHGTVTLDAATGAFVYTPNANFNGGDQFVVSVSDGKGGVTNTTINVGVTPVNDVPTTTDQTLSTKVETPVTGQVAAADVDGDTLSYSLGTSASHGNVTLDPATGNFVYTPNSGYVGADSFTVTVSDGKGGTVTSTLVLGITSVGTNAAPNAIDDSATTTQGNPVTIDVRANDSDADGDSLSVVSVTQGTNGTVTIDPLSGNPVYTPNAGFFGSDTFSYTLSDGKGGTDTASVSLNVIAAAPINHSPIAADDVALTLAGTSVTIAVRANDTDADGDSLTLTGLTQGTHGSVAIDPVSGNPVYTPNASFTGNDSFSYTVSDGRGGLSTATVAVTVNAVPAVNQAPVAVSDSLSTAEDTALVITPATLLGNDSDADGDTLSILSVQGAVKGTVSLVGGNVVFTPDAGYNGPASFTYTLSDGKGATSTATVAINVVSVNDAPHTQAVSATTNEDSVVLVNLSGTDSDGSVVGFNITSLPANGTLYSDAGLSQVVNAGDQVAGPVYFKPANNWNGSTSFNYTAVDNDGLADPVPATASITVNPVADAAVLGVGSGVVKEDTPGQTTTGGTVSISDPDAGEAAFIPQTNLAGTYGTFSLDAAGNWTYSLDNSNPLVQALHDGDKVTDSFTISSLDGTTSSVTVDVHGTLDTTTASLTASGSVVEGGNISYTATLTDPALSPVTINLSNGAVITVAAGATSGSVSVAAPADDAYLDAGNVSVTIASATGGGFESLVADPSAAVTTVSDSIDATTLSLSATGAVNEGGSIVYTASLTNAAQGPVTVTLSNGSVITIADGDTTGSVTVAAPANDVYLSAGNVSVTVAGATGGNFENLIISPTAAVTAVADTLNATNLTLSADTNVSEGGSITYTATLTNAAQGAVTVSLDNGSTITIADGATTGSITLNAPADDTHIDAGNVSVSITSATGGNFEDFVIDHTPAVTGVSDTLDSTTLNLTADATANEGGNITYTANLTNTAEGAVTVTLSNGAVITIADGATSGSVSVSAPANDVYLSAANLPVTISSATGGNFEQLAIGSAPAVTAVQDTIDITSVSITGTTSVTEGNLATYTLALSNAAQSPVTVNLSYSGVAANGSDISGTTSLTIAAGSSSASFDVSALVDGLVEGTENFTVTIDSATGGNFESLVVDPLADKVSTTLLDADTANLSLSATPTITEAGGTLVYTATITQAPVSDLLVSLSNGQTITIQAGQLTGSTSVALAAGDDAYLDPSSLSVSITGTSGGGVGLAVSSTPAVTTITDTIDDTGISLSASSSVAEGGSVVYTATLTNPAQGAVTVTLSNGATITIADSATTGSVSVPVHADTVYVDGGNIAASISSAIGGNFENLVVDATPAVTSVTDSPDITSISLSGPATITEAGSGTYTLSLTNPTQTAVTVTLSYSGTAVNGTDISGTTSVNIPAGSGSATFSLSALADGLVEGAESFTVAIAGATGGNFESLVVNPLANSLTTNVVDADTATVSLSATSGLTEAGGIIVYTATLTAASSTPTLVSLSNGQTINIAAGQLTGSVSYSLANSDDAYVDPGSVSANITGVSGNPGIGFDPAPAVTLISDTVDNTNLSLSATPTVVEGGSVVYTATLTNPAQGAVTVNLSNGAVITIADGAVSGTVTVPVHGNDAEISATSLSVSISSAAGGNFENLSIDATSAVTSVTDSIDVTTLSLSAAANVAEGGSIVYTANVSNPVTGSPLVIHLSNGTDITIPVGSSSATSAAVPVRADDVYAQGNQVVTVGVTGTSGGNYEALDTSATASTTITDNSDTTTVSLAATSSVQEGGSIVYTATLTHAAQGSVTVNLSNGSTITIANGASSGTVSVPVHANTAYVDAGTVSASISSANGGGFENLAVNSTPAVTAVTDSVDVTNITLGAATNVNEGSTVVYTATVSNAVTGAPLVVHLSNGVDITIPVGATSAASTGVAVRADDAYAQGNQNVTVGITGTSGGNYEALNTSSTVTTVVSDNGSTTNVTLSAAANVNEGGSIVYTATVGNAVTGTPLVVHLSNGTDITIPVGATSATSAAVAVRADDAYAQGNQNVTVGITGTSGGNYEALSTSSTVTTVVSDNGSTTNVTLSAAANVNEGGSIVYTATVGNAVTGTPLVVHLSNGTDITIPVGTTSATSAAVAVRADDAYVQGNQNVTVGITGTSGGNYEALNTSSTVTTVVSDNGSTTNVTLSAAANVNEGGSIVYTATVGNAVTGTPLVVHLSNGTDITIPVGATSANSAAVAVRVDDAYAQGNQNVTVGITGTSGGNYEALNTSSTVTTVVSDNGSTTNVTLSAAANVNEGGSMVYTATVGNAVTGTPLVVHLSNGTDITIPVGATSATSAAVAVRADDAYAQGNQNVTVGITGTSGGNYEALNTSSTVSTVVSDDSDVTTLSLTGSTSVAEGSSGSYTLTLTNAAQTAVTVNLNYSGTATNGSDYTGVASVTIPAGSTSASFNIATLTDALTEGTENFTVSIGSVSGGNFESLVVSGSANSVTTSILDNHAPDAVDDTQSGSSSNLGVVSEYFGYREGTDGANLTSLSQIFAFINGRTPDATFTATTFNYAGSFTNNLGAGTNLQTFLGSDAASLSTDPADTSDAIIHMRGFVQLNAGTYNFRVLGDDGYQIKIDGIVVAESNKNQSPTTTVHSQFTVTTNGIHNIEVVYWDQGGQSSFKLELSNDAGTTYNLLSSVPTYKAAGFAVVEDIATAFSKASLLANDTDPDNDSLSIISVQGAVHGTVSMVGSDVIFTPDANYNGPASFTYTLSDGRGGTDTATVNLAVTPVNDAPVAVNDSAKTNVGTALTLTATSLMGNDSDVDADTLSIASVQSAVNGTVNMSGSNITFTPTAGFEGNGSFTYTIKDLEGASSTATVSVAVGTAQAPSVVAEKVLTSIEHSGAAQSISLPIITSLVDTDGSESLSIKITGVPTGATLSAGTYDSVADAWTLTSSDLTNLNLNLPSNYSSGTGYATLTAQVTSTEMYGGYTASTSMQIKLFGASTTTDVTTTTSGSYTGTSANEYITGGSGNNLINANDGHDIVYGLGGDDTISGGNGLDILYGGLGNDSINGGNSADRIYGGAGNDTLTGGSDGAVDVFAWTLGDQGTAGSPAVDTITDFGTAAAGNSPNSGGDILDLRDLLSGDAVGPSNGAGNLANYLHFEISGSNTIIHVSNTGGFSADSHTVSGSYTTGAETQQIVLTGVNLSTLYSNATTDAAIITNLLNNNKLITD